MNNPHVELHVANSTITWNQRNRSYLQPRTIGAHTRFFLNDGRTTGSNYGVRPALSHDSLVDIQWKPQATLQC
jgi:hypothetical protein